MKIKPYTVLVCDDHVFTRTGLAYALQGQDGIRVVGEAGNGEEALALCQSLQPDIVLMDIGMPVIDGITATIEIKKQMPSIKILMLTSRQVKDEVYAALSAGADAYCMKDISTERLCQVFETVSEGGLWLDPVIARMVVCALPKNASENSEHPMGIMLTPREMEVLRQISIGKSNKEIAHDLKLSIHTVKSHVRSLLQKLAVDDRTQMALKAVQDGLL